MGVWGGVRAADADDAGRVVGGWGRVNAADAHDAGRVWCVGEASVQLMLMILPASNLWGRGGVGAADAHEAGRVWGVGEESTQLMLMMLARIGIGEESGQLMFRMLAGFARVGGVSAADAHDAVRVWAVGVKSMHSLWIFLADWAKSVRLMLMMVPRWGVGAESV